MSRDARRYLRFDRNEFAGSFGDIGTDLPLIVGMIAAVGLDSATVFVLFGLLQIASGIFYRLPMPLQPLKAMAVIVISEKISPGVLYGGGMAIGLIMLVLAMSGALSRLSSWMPLCVVRGIQLGLGISLAALALQKYIFAQGIEAWYLASGGFLLLAMFHGNRRFPAGILLMGAGAIYALCMHGATRVLTGPALHLPTLAGPTATELLTGLVLLALPQLPLSLANSVIATRQTCEDLFPEAKVTARKIGVTYALGNLVSALFGGVPVCHGCGGLVGHYAFGARTGGSVIIYGSFYLIAGLWFSHAAGALIAVFPLAILGVVLAFEAFGLMRLVHDTRTTHWHLFITVAVGMTCYLAPHGFLAGTIAGLILYYAPRMYARLRRQA